MIEDMAMRGCVKTRRRDYLRVVSGFACFLGRASDRATAEDIRRFGVHQTESSVQPPTINCSVSALRRAAARRDGTRWESSKAAFLLPVAVLSKLFRRLLLTRLLDLHEKSRLLFFGDLVELADRRAFRRSWPRSAGSEGSSMPSRP